MRSPTQITITFIAVTLAIAASGPAQESRPQRLRQAAETLVQKQAELAEKATNVSRTSADELAVVDGKAVNELAQQLRRHIFARAQGGAKDPLVVLTAQTEAEDLTKIIEDLNTMSRILDKKIGRTQPSRVPILGELPVLPDLFQSSRHGVQTQAMYVQGYAALFFMDVDLPLSPPPQVQTEKLKESTDQVWEQTKWEMTASNIPLEYVHQRDAAARQYEKDKVERLKTDLVKTLKHAANIRNLKGDESVILVVAGTRPGLVVAEHGDEPHRYQYLLSDTGKEGVLGPSVLTIRAKKSDIDAYAKGELDADQFRGRTQMLTSYRNPGPARSADILWHDMWLRGVQ